ncbi:unnamed protein product, partial [Brenthis ino]
MGSGLLLYLSYFVNKADKQQSSSKLWLNLSSDASQSGGSGSDNKQRDNKCDNFSPVKKENESKVKICEVCRAYPCECNPSAPTMYDVRF